ncbi:phosphoribosylglycinamide formyltransferase [Pseudolysobacter antarcticus]|uniref:phosphoribosylglycinamide formyltransferase n=1 Tax=Pseudolysobacter antarcticus TaxID=2511995 RepID=UPI001F5CA3F3|nr:phosphoribosylglycinamide formyltransferase [Pseudolysobacter antarcticus]
MSASAENSRTDLLPIVVLASGRGSNLQALIDARDAGTLAVEIRGVLSDKPKCQALQRARDAGIATVALSPRDYADRASFDRDLFARIAEFSPRLIVLAGFMRVLDPAVVSACAGRMINIHPSLLPKYPGLHTHQRALDAGDALHGSSVHIVTPTLDAGPVIAQAQIQIQSDDNAETLAARLLPLEHHLLCACIALIANDRIHLASDDWRCDGQHLPGPLQLGGDGELAQR